jgi:mannan endo-1,4-beta-mannosidase
MIKYLFTLIITVLTFFPSLAQSSSFVKVKGHQLYLYDKPYYYIGANYWYGSLLGASNNKEKARKRLQKELDFLHARGVNNLRVLAGAEGSGLVNGVERVGPPLQPEQGKFDEKVIESLDLLLYEMGKRNMKAVLFLSNNWEWSGGFLQYLNWNGLIPDSILRQKFTWDALRDNISKFYTCDACKQDYLNQVKYILNHKNKYTNRQYINEPAIMAWELANEPRPMRPSSNHAYQEWIKNVTATIKSIDKNHLITLGHEGDIGTEGMALYEAIHKDKNVDYMTIHIWPKNWGWFKDTAIQESMENVLDNTNDFIKRHKAIAQKLNKPLVIEEFGLPRNNQSFDINSSTSLRDSYYKNIFSQWQISKQKNDVIVGCSFWAFGGIARPIPGQVFWKESDDYMGDPPMEEQGLNTVFDSDESTWKLIESFTKNKADVTKKL